MIRACRVPCSLPCRVYLVGGAQATGTAEDTVVVYTPSVLDHGIYMSNITLPHGRFWSDVIEDPGRQQLCWYHKAPTLPFYA